MNYPAMRYVASEECTVRGPARAILWVIAYHADRDTGECWVGQRRLARESGFARSTVQLALEQLFDDLVLEPVEGARGPKPERYRIAPALVEGEAFGSGMVEAEASISGAVEGDAVVGEVLHNPGASGPAAGPLGSHGNFLVDRSGRASGPIRGPAGELVDRSAESSGLLFTRSPAETGPKVLDQGFELQGENHVLDDASRVSGWAGVVEAPAPHTSVLRELERRGLRPKPRPAPKPEQQPRSREEQLAYLERLAAEEEAKAKSSQEGKGPA